MVIDFHTHTFPDSIADAAVNKLKNMANIKPFSNGKNSGLISSMEKANIDKSVILPVATNPLKVKSMNDYSINNNGKDNLIYFGAMHPLFENCYDELKRIKEAGIKGIKIHPVYQDVDINDIKFLKIFDSAAQLDLIVVTHAGEDIGFPGVIKCSPEMIRDAINKVGKFKFVLAHMGGFRNWENVIENIYDTDVFIDTSFSIGKITSLNEKAENISLLSSDEAYKVIKTLGSERVLFGSDNPWGSQKRTIEIIEEMSLNKEEKENVFYKNALKLLGNIGENCR